MRLLTRCSRVPRWLWSAGIGLGLVAVVVTGILLNTNSRTTTETPFLGVSEPSNVVPPSLPASEPLVLIEESPELPLLDFPPGSVEEECGLNDFPPYHLRGSRGTNSPFNAEGEWVALESEECRTALENHISGINPYLWGATNESRPFAFVKLESPLTFERIFADPTGDLVRVQDALSRPECLLKQGTETNWELKESCHADAFLNYALINRYCFDGGIRSRSRTVYWKEENLTWEQDRFLWKQALEDAWVKRKCEELDPTLELQEYQTELAEAFMTMADAKMLLSMTESEIVARKEYLDDAIGEPGHLVSVFFYPTIIELAARLGDDAAGLVQPVRMTVGVLLYRDEGYKYGRFAELLNSPAWMELSVKKAPSTERFLQTFQMLARVDTRKLIKFDWEWVAQHLCTPPYYKDWRETAPEEPSEPHQSCRAIINEIYRQGIKFPPLLDTMAKFERVAMELDVYD